MFFTFFNYLIQIAEQLLLDHVISHGTCKVLELHESKGLGSSDGDLIVTLCKLCCGDIQLWALKTHFQRELDQQISALQVRSVIRQPSMYVLFLSVKIHSLLIR
jgi:hypothetical protein